MADLNSIVSISISRQTKSASIASFGTPGIIGKFLTTKTTPAFTRARVYSSLAAMTAEGWSNSDDVYKAAAAVFNQNPTPNKIVVGRIDAADANAAAGLSAIQIENDEWYAFTYALATAVDADHNSIAGWVLSQKKIYVLQGTATAIIDPVSTTDIAYTLKASLNERVGIYYHLAANAGEWISAAAISQALSKDPGQATWALKSLLGVTADSLTTSQDGAARGKNANTYTTVAGVPVVMDGKVASGEYLDVIRSIDWLQARIQQEIFTTLVNLDKLPFDDNGITMVQNILTGVLLEAERKGVLIAGTSEVVVPKYANISTADKAARKLTGVTFTAKILGAIQSVTVQGTLTL